MDGLKRIPTKRLRMANNAIQATAMRVYNDGPDELGRWAPSEKKLFQKAHQLEEAVQDRKRKRVRP